MTWRHLILSYIILGYLPLCLHANSKDVANQTTIFQKITAYEKLVLITDLDSLVANKRSNKYQAARFLLTGKNQTKLEMDITVRVRGKFRRRTCALPPVKLNFAKSDLKALGLVKNYDKLKLVTHCQQEKNYDQHLVKEYWAYKMYNSVTDASYRAKLLKVKYIHETDPTRTIDSYAIILENPKELAERLGGELVPQSYGMTVDRITATSYDQTVFFNYMIGNTDWALHVQRNLTLVQLDGDQKYTVIPYDFDQSKLVNAPYLAKHPSIKKMKPDNRHAMGELSSDQALNELTALFKQKKGDFKSYKDCKYLKRKTKGEIASFLYSFYLDLGDKSGMQSEFLAAN